MITKQPASVIPDYHCLQSGGEDNRALAKEGQGEANHFIARLDDAGKQLIAIGTTLQALYIALFITGATRMHLPGRWIVVMSISLGLAVFLAVWAVCLVYVKMEIVRTFQLFRERKDLQNQQLWEAVCEWCDEIKKVANKKRQLLLGSKISLMINFGISLFLLVNALWAGGWS